MAIYPYIVIDICLKEGKLIKTEYRINAKGKASLEKTGDLVSKANSAT